MKTYKITLSIARINEDIDNRTFKRMEASLQQLNETSKDAASSDTAEDHDKLIVSRYRDYREARIRKRLQKYLTEEDAEVTELSNELSLNQENYVFNFSMPDDTRLEQMKAVTTHLHEYIVRGAIFDWYKYAGLQVSDTEQSLEELENATLIDLRGKPSTTRPLQPFGPPFPKTPLF